MDQWTRDSVFGPKYTARSLASFTEQPEPLDWKRTNPYIADDPQGVLDAMQREVKWRYHHGFPQLRETAGFYAAYSNRVDALLESVDLALATARIDVAESSIIDIAAAEGYVANHLHERGAYDIDALELSDINIRRIWMVRAAKGVEPGRVGRLDLENVLWSRALDRRYDLSLALGIVYHLESPMLFLRNLFEITKHAALVESDTPVFPDNERFRGFGVTYLHRDQVTIGPGDVRYLTEMRPDRQALVEMLLAVGFTKVIAIPPPSVTRFRMFDSGEKSVLLALR